LAPFGFSERRERCTTTPTWDAYCWAAPDARMSKTKRKQPGRAAAREIPAADDLPPPDPPRKNRALLILSIVLVAAWFVVLTVLVIPA
jgi:hypothetical protein